jgi:hypothetical protein
MSKCPSSLRRVGVEHGMRKSSFRCTSTYLRTSSAARFGRGGQHYDATPDFSADTEVTFVKARSALADAEGLTHKRCGGARGEGTDARFG